MKDRVKQIAESIFRAVLKVNADNQGTFRVIISVKVSDEIKPLLILGNAHGKIEDGTCIAILNPDEDLLSDSRVIADSIYYGDTLKTLVRDRCDLMLRLWIDIHETDNIKEVSGYVSKNPQLAKFEV